MSARPAMKEHQLQRALARRASLRGIPLKAAMYTDASASTANDSARAV